MSANHPFNKYFSMPDHEYHALPYVSQTKLKKLAQLEPAQWAEDCKIPFNGSDATRLGSVMHLVNLNEMSLSDIKTFKKLDGRTKEGKEQAKELEGTSIFLWEHEVDQAFMMAANFKSSHNVKGIMDNSVMIEQAGVCEIYNERNKDVKIYMKFKPDIVGVDFIADYKTIGDYCTDDNLRSAIKRSDYAFQAASYLILDGMISRSTKVNYYMIFQETVKPYGCRVVILDQNLIQKAYDRFDNAIKKYTKMSNGMILDPNYKDVTELTLPYY